jgi:hypothetical protein
MIVAYQRGDAPSALNYLDGVTTQDSSIYAAYQAAADMKQVSDPRRALDYLKQAVQLDPDLVDAWHELGKLAAKLEDKRALAEATAKLAVIAPGSAALRELIALKR